MCFCLPQYNIRDQSVFRFPYLPFSWTHLAILLAVAVQKLNKQNLRDHCKYGSDHLSRLCCKFNRIFCVHITVLYICIIFVKAESLKDLITY